MSFTLSMSKVCLKNNGSVIRNHKLNTEGGPNLSVYRVRTVPCPYRVRTVSVPCPYRVRTVSVPCPYRVRTVSVPCPYRVRFPRETVVVDREAYRTFLTVFRDFCLKARTLPRFKFYRSTV
jgi:hypothetical protein